jgi:hypothetical protein
MSKCEGRPQFKLRHDRDLFVAETITLKVSALDPGEYVFQCDLNHLRMNGTFLVGG